MEYDIIINPETQLFRKTGLLIAQYSDLTHGDKSEPDSTLDLLFLCFAAFGRSHLSIRGDFLDQ